MNGIDFKLYFYYNNRLFDKKAVQKGRPLILTVGSGQDVDIRLTNTRISRQHLQIIYDRKGGLSIQDLGSTNGTLFNGISLLSGVNQTLKHKDTIQLAGVNGILIVIEKINSNVTIEQSQNIFDKFKGKNRIFIGRSVKCDIVLNFPTVSKYHASITKMENGTYFLEDGGSRNGTYVNGVKIKKSKEITINDRIFIGRHQLSFSENGLTKILDLNEELAITAVGIEKTYPNGVKALKKMDLSVPSKHIIAIMGPSGCGKSTLLKALNGDTPSTRGKVFLFNLELSKNWQYLKTQIGYVPQDDIVHQELTVKECLWFTAKLRLDNVSDNYIEEKIDQVLSDLNILEKKNNLISSLSGGQRKRVSIAVELLTDPLMIFLDEPTSPLDPQTVDDFLSIMKKLSEKGTTVLMVTHKPEDLEYMDEVIFMAEGGYIVYYGDTKKYKEYFAVKTAVSVFSQISGDSAKLWVDRYLNPRPLSDTSNFASIKTSSEISSLKQFMWLTRRYFAIKTNDKMNSLLMIAQAPIIAILICLIFNQLSSAVLFMIAISAIWLGTQNAAREIVSESAIYKRERMYNLHIFPYLLSKISVLTIFAILQSFIFICILFIFYHDSKEILNNPSNLFLWMVFLSIASTFLGLLLSSVVKTTERAMTILPLILLPQIMLAGLITKVNNGFVEFISYFTISRWGVEGFNILQKNIVEEVPVNLGVTVEGISVLGAEEQSVDATDFLLDRFHESYRNKDIFGDLTCTLSLDIYAICIMIMIITYFIYKTLRKKDSV